MSRQVSRGSDGEYQADERAGVAGLSWVTHAAQVYARLEAAGARVVDVHMPSWAGLFLTVIQLDPAAKGEGLEVLRSLLNMPFIHKFLVAVDADVNIYEDR